MKIYDILVKKTVYLELTVEANNEEDAYTEAEEEAMQCFDSDWESDGYEMEIYNVREKG